MSIQPIPPTSGATTAGQLVSRAYQNDQALAALLGDHDDRLTDLESQSDTSGTVTSVNGIEPDASGNIILTGLDAGIQVGGTAPADGWWIDTGSDGGSVPATIPGKVTGLSATNNNGTIALEWVAPADGGSPITDYTVQHKGESASTWTTYADGVSAITGATLTGLPSVLHDFRVGAVNSVGTGAWSDVAQATPAVDTSLLGSDDFNRPDNASLGTDLTGKTWVSITSSTHTRIRSNQAETVKSHAVLDVGVSTGVRVEADYVAAEPVAADVNASLYVCASGTGGASGPADCYGFDTITAGTVRLVQVVAGTTTIRASASGTVAQGSRMRLDVTESGGQVTLTGFIDDVQVITWTGAHAVTGTHVGFGGSGSAYGRFDNFRANVI